MAVIILTRMEDPIHLLTMPDILTWGLLDGGMGPSGVRQTREGQDAGIIQATTSTPD